MVRFFAGVVFSAGGRKRKASCNSQETGGKQSQSLHSYSMVGLVMKITLSNRNYISSLNSSFI